MKLDWKFRNGSHFFCSCLITGNIETVLGVAAPIEGGRFVGCAQNKFDTYHDFDTLEQAKVHIEGVVALEGMNEENSDD